MKRYPCPIVMAGLLGVAILMPTLACAGNISGSNGPTAPPVMQKGEVGGLVTNEAGVPLAGIQIYCGQYGGPGRTSSSVAATTDADGRFHFTYQKRNMDPNYLLCQAQTAAGIHYETRILAFPPLVEGAASCEDLRLVCRPVEPGILAGTTLPVITAANEDDLLWVEQLVEEAGVRTPYSVRHLTAEKGQKEGQTFTLRLAPGRYKLTLSRYIRTGPTAESVQGWHVMEVDVRPGETTNVLLGPDVAEQHLNAKEVPLPTPMSKPE